MLITNPGKGRYQLYASDLLLEYLKEEGCHKVKKEIISELESSCKVLLDVARPQIINLVDSGTEQKNFFLFSVYETEFELTNLTPHYRFATVGICDRFFTYQLESNN